MGKHQPALLGGLFIGVLSSLPLLAFANVCCCLWVVLGGGLTVYLQQQRTSEPVETGDAVLAGLLAGLIGATITVVVNIALTSMMGPLWNEQMRTALDSPDVPPEVRDWVQTFINGQGIAVLMFAVTLPVYAIFSMLGSLLGLAIFRKKTPPQAPVVEG